MNHVFVLLMVLLLSPFSILAQNLSIAESVSYLNSHLSDLEFSNEEWDIIQYDEESNTLWIDMYYWDEDYEYDDLLMYTLYLDGSYSSKEAYDEDGSYILVTFANNDVFVMDYYEEYDSNEFYFANKSVKTTKVFLDLLDLIHAKSQN